MMKRSRWVVSTEGFSHSQHTVGLGGQSQFSICTAMPYFLSCFAPPPSLPISPTAPLSPGSLLPLF